MHFATRHRTTTVQGHEVFYREAGDPSNPTVVLLHGFPASSFMFRNLLDALADRFHLIAPDHIGFGRSAMPRVDEFHYTFENLSAVTFEFLEGLELGRFALYVQDYGAPIGLRIASRHPDHVNALIIQNGNAYVEGLTEFWDPLFAYAADGVTNVDAVRASMDPVGTQWVYRHGVPERHADRLAPEAWIVDQAHLDREGNREIQLALFRDYATNLDEYPAFQRTSVTTTRQPLWCGVSTTRSSARTELVPFRGISPKQRSTSSTRATSPWRPAEKRSQD